MSDSNPIIREYTSEVAFKVGKELCLNTDMADVYFIFNSDDGSIERVPGHKIILRAGSNVFRTMFNGTWKEMDEVEIVDVSADAFKEFLQFFYLGRVKLTMENVVKVMDLGDKYNVTECLPVCSEFIKNNLNDENVCLFYGPAVLYDQKNLKQACETIIGLNTNAVLKSSGFLACDKRSLVEILKVKWLFCSEVELFEACISWLKATGKQDNLTKELVQALLGDSFYDIRFELMSLQEYSTLISNYGDLFTQNIADIIDVVANRELKMNQSNEKRGKRHSFPWNDADLIQCDRWCPFSEIPCQGFFDGRSTIFSSNKSLLLRKITLVICKIHYASNYKPEIIINEISNFKTSNSKIEKCFDEKVDLKTLKSDEFVLPKPINIKTESLYEIRLVNYHNCGVVIKSKVFMNNGIVIKFYNNLSESGSSPSINGPIHCLFFFPIEK